MWFLGITSQLEQAKRKHTKQFHNKQTSLCHWWSLSGLLGAVRWGAIDLCSLDVFIFCYVRSQVGWKDSEIYGLAFREHIQNFVFCCVCKNTFQLLVSDLIAGILFLKSLSHLTDIHDFFPDVYNKHFWVDRAPNIQRPQGLKPPAGSETELKVVFMSASFHGGSSTEADSTAVLWLVLYFLSWNTSGEQYCSECVPSWCDRPALLLIVSLRLLVSGRI